MENIEIKKVGISDIELLQKIGRKTFEETFSSQNTEENMRRYVEESFSVEKLTAELSNKKSQFYFTLLDGNPIAYLKLNSKDAQTETRYENALEIERIYALSAFHGRGVGQVLYKKAMRIADEINAPYVWLGVWEKNERALSFYKKNGFVEFDRHIFKLGDDEQIDIMMKKTR